MEESRVLLVNGSPKGARSDTLKLACAFLEGMGERGAEIEANALDIAPCRGCFSCWRDEGRCVQPDDMARILERVAAAELIVWSTPLYCYGVPSACKAILDRLLPLSSPAMRLDEREVNVVKGDGKCASIAAASIVAKVERDALMCRYAEEYPEYGFDACKGYASAAHIEAIKRYGLTPIHRASFCTAFTQPALF